jgi:hypothetical protein
MQLKFFVEEPSEKLTALGQEQRRLTGTYIV